MTRSLALLFVCALLAGCGGGDDDGGSDGGDGPSDTAFAAEVNKICAEGEKKISEIQPLPEGDKANNPDEVRAAVAGALEKTAEAYQPYLDRLRDVEPPEELSEGYSAFLDGIEGAFDKIPEVADATRANDQDRLEELAQEFTEVAQDTRPFAEEHGLTECLQDQPEAGG
jgi:hypothetical protein